MTEAELCERFIEGVSTGLYGRDWTFYRETGGFDILAVHRTGVQVGIEAKLAPGLKVIGQALRNVGYTRYQSVGPDHRAILVPRAGDMKPILDHLGIDLFLPPVKNEIVLWGADSDLLQWYPWFPTERVPLPDYVPDVRAGVASPLVLSLWKVKALRVLALIELTGYVTRRDCDRLGISPTRWMAEGYGWLRRSPDHRHGYVEGPDMPDFRGQHPEVYRSVVQTFDNWSPRKTDQR